MRAFDVDDDYVGGTIAPEVDVVTVNGTPVGTLSGADNQWSYTTLEFDLGLLRFPTDGNPRGRNDFQVLIDTENTSDQWAVEVASADLRLSVDAPPVAFNHGFGGGENDLGEIETLFLERFEEIAGRTTRTSVTKRGSIADNADLLETQLGQFLDDTGSFTTNVVAHSMGGLNTRLYAFDHPSQISRFVMLGTPNGGTRVADILCGVQKGPRFDPTWLVARELVRRQFGECGGPDDGMFQLQQSYVQDVFNPQVPDLSNVYYGTIAGMGNDIRNVLIDGEDDGLVSVNSVEYLSRFDNPERGGQHWPLDVFNVNHTGLLSGEGGAASEAFCAIYPSACIPVIGPRTEATAAASALGPQQIAPELTTAHGASIPAGGQVSIPVAFEAASSGTVVVLADDPAVTGTIDGTALVPTELFGVPVLAATLESPPDTNLILNNASTAEAQVAAMAVIETARRLSVDVPTLTPSGEAVPITVTLVEAVATDDPTLVIVDAAGAAVATPQLVPVGDGRWSAQLGPVAGGVYSAYASVDGTRPRSGSAVFSVSSGAISVDGTYATATPDDNGNGLHDALVVDTDVTVAQAGSYRIAAKLVDRTGTLVATTGSRAVLPIGSATMELSFAGIGIFRSGADGAYRIVDVVISNEDLTMEDRADLVGETQAYTYRAFEHFPVEFDSGAFVDHAEDLDSDGTFDRLAVDGAVTVDFAGSYALNARLVNSDGVEIGEYQTTTAFSSGRNTFSLSFDWEDIAAGGVDGPFVVRDLTAYPLSNSSAAGFLPRAHTTAAYPVADGGEASFEALLALLAGSVDQGEIIHKGLVRSLEAKLEAGHAAFERDNVEAARNILTAFRNELDARRSQMAPAAFERLDSAAVLLMSRL